jgi:hypothetical protein
MKSSSCAIGTLLAITALTLGGTTAAYAEAGESPCEVDPPSPHPFDSALAAVDTVPPRQPVVIAVDAYRRSGLTCGQETCLENHCGDTAAVSIDLAPTDDDQTPPERMGYRLELVSGVVPESLHELLGVNLAGRSPLVLDAAFDELPSLSATFTAVAIDAAGNESPPSDPFSIRFAGCTLAAVGDLCEHEVDPDSTLSVTLEPLEPGALSPSGSLVGVSGADGSAGGGVPHGSSCSVATSPPSSPASISFTALAALLVGCAAWARASSRRRGY